MKPTNQKSLIFIILILALVGCTSFPTYGAPSANKPGTERKISPTSEPLAEPMATLPLVTDQTSNLPVAVHDDDHWVWSILSIRCGNDAIQAHRHVAEPVAFRKPRLGDRRFA